MKFRMNGRSFRSASDIADIIASIPTEPLSPAEVESRVMLYSGRQTAGVDLWTGEPINVESEQDDELISDGTECSE